MQGYVDAADLVDFGIIDPAAVDLIDQASDIIDLYVMFPANTEGDWEGRKFPRAEDNDVVPTLVKRAVMEQILWLRQEGMIYVRKGGNDAISMATGGQSRVRAEATTPLLAPLAKLYLKSYMTRVGRANHPQGWTGNYWYRIT